ncbi:MAG TPA: PqiA/YebS family transporter subunit [Gammaproteobacteria bacterium]|nr:PqiA/YebS family transporter subunit [Gammaproteobacteria bacterium]
MYCTKVSELARLIACHECAAIYRRTPIVPNATANCQRCDAMLYRHIPDSLNRSLALYITALMLWVIANLFPFLGMKVGGIYHENLLFAGGWALYQNGMGELGLVVFLTSIVFPLVTILGMIYLLLPARLGIAPPQAGHVFQLVRTLEPWNLISVFMLGTLIAVVKLQELATVVPGLSLAALSTLLVVYAMARSQFDSETLWQRIEKIKALDTAVTSIRSDDKILHCHLCDGLQTKGHSCNRCGAAIHHRIEGSIQQTWALLFSALLMLIPANLFPVMTFKKLGKGAPDTIYLIEGGLWGLGLIVLFASIIVPITKLLSLSFLLYSVQKNSNWKPKDRALLYRVIEVIGSWSMVDVFLVGLLSGLVSLGLLANVTPGIGASFFGAAVILTMLAAHQFDPRLIWDRSHHNSAVAL